MPYLKRPNIIRIVRKSFIRINVEKISLFYEHVVDFQVNFAALGLAFTTFCW